MSLLSKQIDWYLTSHRLYFNHLTAILLKNTVRSCIGIYCCWKALPLVRNGPLFWISKKSNRLVVLERKRTYSLFLISSDLSGHRWLKTYFLKFKPAKTKGF